MAQDDQTLEARAQQKARASWKILPLIGVSVLVCVVLVWRLSSAEAFYDALAGAQWAWAPLALVALCVNMTMAVLRWRVILDSMGVRLGFWRALEVMLCTWPFALLTPSRASDLLRAVAIRDRLPIASGSSSVVAERLVDVQSLFLLGMMGSVMTGLWWWFGLLVLGLLAEWSVAWLLLTKKSWIAGLPVLRRAQTKITRLFDAFEALRTSPLHFLKLSVASLLSWCAAMSILFSFALVFRAPVTLIQVIALWPLAIFVGMLPLTISGVGTRDAAFVYLLTWTGSAGLEEASILAATFFYAITTLVLPALVGFPLMLRWLGRMSWSLTDAAPADTSTSHSSETQI